jgi:hypothetical protein
VHTETLQSSTQINQSWAIQAQSHNRCASSRCNADNLGRIVTPCEVFRPHLPSRVKQWNFLLRHGIEAGLERPFEAVASQTR